MIYGARPVAVAVAAALALIACSGGLKSDAPAVQAWRLEPPAPAAPVATASGTEAPSGPRAATLQVLRPLAAPGLDTERIALRQADHSLSYYAANRWAERAPELVQALAIDTLRAAGRYRAVEPEGAPFAYDETLQIELRDFQADYSGEGAPQVRVALDCTLGRRSDRAVLATFRLEGSAAAAADRMSAIVAAFDAALGAALDGLPARLDGVNR